MQKKKNKNPNYNKFKKWKKVLNPLCKKQKNKIKFSKCKKELPNWNIQIVNLQNKRWQHVHKVFNWIFNFIHINNGFFYVQAKMNSPTSFVHIVHIFIININWDFGVSSLNNILTFSSFNNFIFKRNTITIGMNKKTQMHKQHQSWETNTKCAKKWLDSWDQNRSKCKRIRENSKVFKIQRNVTIEMMPK